MIRVRKYAGMLCAILVFCVAFLNPLCQVHSAGKKKEVHRTIAIVFDNSGSMYLDGDKMAWCHATYAMEVFASMMNEGDTLKIFPMWSIEVPRGGQTYNLDSPLVLHGPSEALRIRDIYTPGAWSTPIDSIYAAYNDLIQSVADEKWLIVLTDGSQFFELPNTTPFVNNWSGLSDRERDVATITIADTQKRLSNDLKTCASQVNTLYLGIGDMKAPDFSSSGGFQTYADTARESKQTLEKLTIMSNMIFGRNELKLNGTEMEFDLPLTRLIAFVQGKDLSGLTLKDSGGSPINSISQHNPRYSEAGHGADTGHRENYDPTNDIKDTSLQGTMQSYENLSPGRYSLDYSGSASSVAVYYEPDVDLAVRLIDGDGNVWDGSSSTLVPGKYKLEYGLTDKDGNFTESALLGNNQKYNLFINGQQAVQDAPKHGMHEIELRADDSLLITASAEYLNGYYIEKDSEQLGFPAGGFTVSKRQAGNLELIVSGGQNQYTRDELEKAVYEVQVRYDGQPLTGDLLTEDLLTVSEPGGGITRIVEKTADGYRVKLSDPSGEAAFGHYSFNISATYAGADGQSETSGDSESKEFELAARSAGSLDITVSGGEDQYERSQLESDGIYQVQIMHNGNKVSGDMLDRISFETELSPAGIRCESEKTGDGYRIKLLPEGSSQDVPFGNYVLKVSASYTNEDNQSVSSDASKAFSLVPKKAGKLEMTLSGDAKEVKLSELEDTVFKADFRYEGETLKGEVLKNLDVKAELAGGNALVVSEAVEDGILFKLKYNGKPEDTQEGDYTLKVNAFYTNEDGQKTEPVSGEKSFHVENDGFGITMKVVRTQGSVEIKKIDSADPIVVEIRNNNQPLTAEEFARVNFSVKPTDGSRFFYTLEPRPEDSNYVIRLDPKGAWENGTQRFICQAEGVDPVGKAFSVEKESSVKIIPFAAWIKWAIAGAVLAVVSGLIWAFMNMKVLPKNIVIQPGSEVFKINGSPLKLKGAVSYSGGGKKRGTITIRTPNAPSYALAKGSITMDLEAVGRRYESSKKRKIKVYKNGQEALSGTSSISRAAINNARVFGRPIDSKKLVVTSTGNPEAFWKKGFELGNFKCVIDGADKSDNSFHYECQLIRKNKK